MQQPICRHRVSVTSDVFAAVAAAVLAGAVSGSIFAAEGAKAGGDGCV